MSTGVGTGVAGDVFQVDTGSGSGIRPDPKRYTNNYSVFFNGIDQFLQGTARAAGGPEVPLLGDSGTGDFSVSLWFKGDNINPNYGQNLINNSDFSEIGSNIVNQFDVNPYTNGWSLFSFPNTDVSPLTQVVWQPQLKQVRMTIGLPGGNTETNFFASFTPDQDVIYKFQVEVKTTVANVFKIHTNVATNTPTTGGSKFSSSAFAQGTGSFETLTLYARGGDRGNAVVFRLQGVVNSPSTKPPGTFTATFRNPTLQKIDPNNYWIESNISPAGTTGWYPTDGELRMDEGDTSPYQTNRLATLGNNKLNNANFTEIGSELVQNHAFNEISDQLVDLTSGSTSAPSSWEVLNATNILFAGSTNALEYYNTGFTVTLGKAYRISLTVESYSGSGDFGWSSTGGVPNPDMRLSGNGTVTRTFVANANVELRLFGRNTNTGQMTVSLQQLDPDDDWTLENGWELRFGDARRSGVSVNSGIGQTFSVNSGKTYKIGYDRTYESGTNGTTNMFGEFTTSGVQEVKCQLVSTTVEEVTVTDHFIPQYSGSTGSMRWFGIGDWTGTFDNCTFREMDPNNYWSNPSAFFDVFIKEGFAEFINAATGNRLQQNFGVVTGQEYQISFEIFDYSSGGVNVYLGGGYASGSTITANGTYTFYRTASSGSEFFFRAMSGANANFKIRNITVKEFNPGTMYRTLRNNAIAQLQNGTEYKVVIDFGSFTTVGNQLSFFSMGEPFSNRSLIPAGTTGVYEFNHTPTGTGNPGLYCSDNPVQIKSISVTENQAVNHRLWSFGSGGGAVQTQMQVNKNSNIQLSGPYSHVASNFTIDRNRWYNVILRVARSGSALTSGIVINGSHKDNTNKTVPTTFNQGGLAFIGRNAGSYNFEGHIDEFSIWNKNLSDAECLEIYNNGVPNNLNASTMSTNLMHWWRMGELPGPPSFPTIIDQAQTTTSGNQVENGNFTEVGTELITNPEFQILNNIVRNPNFDELGSELAPASDFATDFEANPASGSVSQSNGTITFTNSTSTGSQVQLKNRSISTGETYKIQFTVSNYSSGNFRMSVGNQITDSVTANGTYTFYVKYNNGLARNYFYSSGSTLTVSEISVKQVDPDGDWSSTPTDSWKYTSNNTVTYTNEVVGSDLVQNGQFNELGSELVLNGDFEELGSELVTNGDFSTSGTITNNSWSLGFRTPDGGISIENDVLNLVNEDNSSFDGRVNFTNGTNAALNITVGKTFVLEYEILENSNSSIFGVFDGNSYIYTTNTVGTHKLYYVSEGTTVWVRNGGNNSTIKLGKLSLKQVDPNDRWNLGTGWSYGDGIASCDGSQSSTSNFSQGNVFDTPPQTLNDTYKLTFDLVVTSGSITASSGNMSQSYTTSGTKTLYGVPAVGAGNLNFTAGSTFIGSIDNVSVKQVDPNDNWSAGVGGAPKQALTDVATLTVTGGFDIMLRQNGILTSGKTYKITYNTDLSGITSGSLKWQQFSNSSSARSILNGTNSVILTANGSDLYVSEGGAIGTAIFTSIAVEEITGDSSLLQTSVLDIGKTYKFTVVVDSIGSGNLQLKAGSSFLLQNMQVPGTYTGLFRVQSTTLTLRSVNTNLGDSIVVSKITAEELPFFATISTNDFNGGIVNSPTLTIDGAKGLKLGGTASELFASNIFQNDRSYQVQADVKSVVSGNFAIVSRNSANSTGPISTPGLHTFSFNTGTLISATYFISNNGNFNGVIKSVSVKELDPNNKWSPDDGWTLGSGFARYYNPGVAGNLEQNISAVVGDLYQISFKTLSDATGNFAIALSSSYTFISPVTANTSYTLYIVATGATLRLRATTNFSGSISDVEVKRISGGASMTAIDMTMNNQTASDIQTDTP